MSEFESTKKYVILVNDAFLKEDSYDGYSGIWKRHTVDRIEDATKWDTLREVVSVINRKTHYHMKVIELSYGLTSQKVL